MNKLLARYPHIPSPTLSQLLKGCGSYNEVIRTLGDGAPPSRYESGSLPDHPLLDIITPIQESCNKLEAQHNQEEADILYENQDSPDSSPIPDKSGMNSSSNESEVEEQHVYDHIPTPEESLLKCHQDPCIDSTPPVANISPPRVENFVPGLTEKQIQFGELLLPFINTEAKLGLDPKLVVWLKYTLEKYPKEALDCIRAKINEKKKPKQIPIITKRKPKSVKQQKHLVEKKVHKQPQEIKAGPFLCYNPNKSKDIKFPNDPVIQSHTQFYEECQRFFNLPYKESLPPEGVMVVGIHSKYESEHYYYVRVNGELCIAASSVLSKCHSDLLVEFLEQTSI